MEENFQLGVAGELGTLKRVLVHRPDAGIGLIPTHKTEEWLYDDIVDVPTMQREFDVFRKLLDLMVGTAEATDVREHPVMDSQALLELLVAENPEDALELIISLCTLEEVNFPRKDDLLAMLEHGKTDPTLIKALVQTLLSGQLAYASLAGEKPHRLPAGAERYIFAPIPNFIFTRDIGITMGDHLLITQPKYDVRRREVWLFRFIAEHFLVRHRRPLRFSVGPDDHHFLQDTEQEKLKAVSYEGGDIMMISPRHVLIGWSERTTPYAIEKLVKQIFWLPIQTGSSTGIDTVSVVKIGARRSQMHIDTVFTHLRNDVWALHALLAEQWQAEQVESRIEPVEVFQYHLHEEGRSKRLLYAT
ncbi:MAG: arginine deiminase family protein, partial [Bacteroidota bacterium]